MTDVERRNLYMQNPFEILTKEELDRLERHCKKAILYERGHIREEHQVTLELIYKYQEQQTELEKKDKIIDLMSEQLTTPIHSKEWVIEYYTKKVEDK